MKVDLRRMTRFATERQLAAISSYFDLGSVLSQQQVGGNANENYLVTTEMGEFIFKLLLNHPLEDSATGDGLSYRG